MQRTENEIMNGILNCYCALSPENLWMDGEATPFQAAYREREIRAELKGWLKKLGRPVSESEIYDWARDSKEVD